MSIRKMAKKQKNLKINQTFGQRFRLLREKAGFNQDELAKKLGYKNNASISHIEKGRSTLDNITLAKLADIFNEADLHWLLTGQVVVDKEFESAYEKLLTSYAALVARSLVQCFEYRKSSIYEINEMEKKIKKGEEIDQQLLDELKRDFVFYTNELAKLSEEQPWLQQAIEIMIKEGKKASYKKILQT